MISRFVSAIVRVCSRSAWPIAIFAILLGIVAGHYTAEHFQIDTNSDNLVSPKADWRAHELQYDRAFPQQNGTIVVVVDGATAERADEAAGALAAALTKDHAHFLSVRRPDGGAFFAREGLLLLPLK